MTWLKRKAVEFCHSQWLDWSNVRPQQRWNPVKRTFFLVSCAGTITFKAKVDRDVAEFRDKYINRFEAIRREPVEDQPRLFHELYSDIIKLKKTKYKANIRTRLQRRVWNLRNYF
jgi:phosphoglycolate phosphatase-like HAD superfamily hydrolase